MLRRETVRRDFFLPNPEARQLERQPFRFEAAPRSFLPTPRFYK